MTEEIWRVVSWAPRYSVSSMGRVRGPRKMLRPTLRNGYFAVLICPCPGVVKNTSIHTLMLEQFVGPRPPGFHGCHNNGVKTENRLSNLRWDSPKGNKADQVRHGTIARGETSGTSRFTASTILAIRNDYQRGVRGRGAHSTGVKHGASESHVLRIVRGEAWRHLG